MTDAQIAGIIEQTVKKSVIEYKKAGLLKDANEAAYNDVSEILSTYYRGGKKDSQVTYAIQAQRFDPYFQILPMYFGDKLTLELIADEYNVEVSTIVRNKKRLCLAIYESLM